MSVETSSDFGHKAVLGLLKAFLKAASTAIVSISTLSCGPGQERSGGRAPKSY